MIENTKLIQIISRQTMPNLLAAMAVKPARIVHICTPSMKGVSAALTKAYREAGVKVDVQELAVDEKPLMPEMFAAVTQAIKGESAAVVNFTGGTKPMSIGAYGAANAARVPSFYVDTDRGEFLDGRTGQGLVDFFPNGDLSLGQVNRQLTVNCSARANGVERVTGGLDWKPDAALADRLLRDPDLEENCHDYVAEAVSKVPHNYQQAKDHWSSWYSQPLDYPEEICKLGVEAGLFEEENGCYYAARRWSAKIEGLDLANCRYPRDVIFDAMQDVAWPFVFFNGNWWEIAVMRAFAESGKARDLRWSVDAGSRSGGSTDMEEDILGVDGVNLLYVSCKRGGDKAKLSRTLEDVNSSGLRLGGDFAHKVIAVYKEISGKDRQAILNRCRELHLQLFTRDDAMRAPAL